MIISIFCIKGVEVKILFSKLILTPDRILFNKAVAFDEKILEIGELEPLKKRYPQAKVLEFPDSILLPTFANPHLHLEFSANCGTLSFGDFLSWLYSVIAHREELLSACDENCIQETLNSLIQTGTTAIGEVSSYGEEIEVCASSKMKVVLFNEVIGANPATVDVSYSSFLERFSRAKKLESENFKSAVAIHSPYSVHYILAKRALEIARREGCLVSVHFMESLAERKWLDKGRGEFALFFQRLLGQSRPINDPLEFLELFEGLKTLYVHMVYANEKEWEKVKDSTIIHCPISNRLLGNGVLDLNKAKNYLIATDGLSSNYTLNMYEELRATLFLHPNRELLPFAKELIIRSTKMAHQTLGFNAGEIKEGKLADFQLVPLQENRKRCNLEEAYQNILLYTSKPQAVFIQGERVV